MLYISDSCLAFGFEARVTHAWLYAVRHGSLVVHFRFGLCFRLRGKGYSCLALRPETWVSCYISPTRALLEVFEARVTNALLYTVRHGFIGIHFRLVLCLRR